MLVGLINVTAGAGVPCDPLDTEKDLYPDLPRLFETDTLQTMSPAVVIEGDMTDFSSLIWDGLTERTFALQSESELFHVSTPFVAPLLLKSICDTESSATPTSKISGLREGAVVVIVLVPTSNAADAMSVNAGNMTAGAGYSTLSTRLTLPPFQSSNANE